MKKLLGLITLSLIAVLLLPTSVFATTKDDIDNIVKKLSPDLKTAIIYMKKPTTPEEADFGMNGYISNMMAGEDYHVFGYYDLDKDVVEISFQSKDYESGDFLYYDTEANMPVFDEPKAGWKKDYTITPTFDEPKENSTVSNYIDKLNDFDRMTPSTFYVIEDLSLINYYTTSDKSELWNPGAPGRALKYSSINDLTKGANVSFYIDLRAGSQDETLMYEFAEGPMSIFYNGYLYGSKIEGLYIKRVIYISEDTKDDPDEYVKAAQKRINDYLENESVTVSKGGLLSSLPEDSEDDLYPIANDGNYYNVKSGSRTYKFYIVKGTADQLKEPVYTGLDLESNIEITTYDASVPLDTALTVKDVTNSSTKDIIGTSNYKSYDIALFSSAKNADIETLENGKFRVKIPVPEELKGKNLIVYYITADNKIEKHEVTPEGDYAVFETDHFSTYTLAESSEIPNPATGDDIVLYTMILIFSVVGMVLTKAYEIKLKTK